MNKIIFNGKEYLRGGVIDGIEVHRIKLEVQGIEAVKDEEIFVGTVPVPPQRIWSISITYSAGSTWYDIGDIRITNEGDVYYIPKTSQKGFHCIVSVLYNE